jgi:transcriptional regulator with XRE-family HTH domain
VVPSVNTRGRSACNLRAMIDLATPEERRAEAQRLLAGLNGQWVAERMSRDRNTIALWKSGKRIPDLQDLLKLPSATKRPLSAWLQERLARYVESVSTPTDSEEERAADAGAAELPRLLDAESEEDPEVDDLDSVKPR